MKEYMRSNCLMFPKTMNVRKMKNPSSKGSKVAGNGITKSRKTKKESISKLKKQLMLLVKAYIHDRDSDICQKCGKHVTGSNCQVSHVIPVSYGNRLAFESENMKILCYHCHLSWWHKNPMDAAHWFENTFPKRWDWLQDHKNEIVDWKAEDYKIKIEEAKQGIF